MPSKTDPITPDELSAALICSFRSLRSCNRARQKEAALKIASRFLKRLPSWPKPRASKPEKARPQSDSAFSNFNNPLLIHERP